MSYTPLSLPSTGDIQQETRENIEPSFGAELVARFTQGNIEGSTVRKFVFNINEEQDARLRAPELLTPEQANAEFGIENVLEFQGNITRGEAELKKFRILQNQDKERFIAKAAASEGIPSKVGNLFIALGSMAASPESAIPFGELLHLRKLALFSKLGPLGKGITRGAIDGVLGNAVAIPTSIANFEDVGQEYTFTDALVDVGVGAIFGGALGAGGAKLEIDEVLSKRGARNKFFSTQKAILDEFTKLDTQRKVMKQTLSEEGAAALDTYLNSVDEPNSDMIKAIGKLGEVYASDTDRAPHFLLNDTLLRTNFDNLTDEASQALIELVGKSRLVSDSLSLDIKRARALFDLGRVSELPPEVASFLSKVKPGDALSKFENSLTVREFTESIGELASLKSYKQLLTDTLGKRFDSRTLMSEKQALALFKELDELDHVVKNIKDPQEILRLVKEFQVDLRNVKGGADLSLKNYTKKLNSFKQLLDQNPQIREMSISDLAQLSPELRGKVTELMKFIQEANPNETQLRGFLRGDKAVARELFESAKVNKALKDSLTTEQAIKILEDGITGGEKGLEPNSSPLGEENVRVDERLEPAIEYLNEKAEAFKLDLDEAEVTQVETLVDKQDGKFRKIVKGAKEALNCFLGN